MALLLPYFSYSRVTQTRKKKNEFLLTAEDVKRDFYIHFLMSDSNSFENALQLRVQINNLFRLDYFE
jgi:hypothetical protein